MTDATGGAPAGDGGTASDAAKGEATGVSGLMANARGGAAIVVALVALVAFGVVVVVLWDKADDPDNETAWARWTFLLAGVEAVAFAGAGWLFGREVHRAQAEAAQDQADVAQQAARAETGRAASAEAHGRALRNAIETKRERASQRTRREGYAGPTEPSDDLEELATLARQIFP